MLPFCLSDVLRGNPKNFKKIYKPMPPVGQRSTEYSGSTNPKTVDHENKLQKNDFFSLLERISKLTEFNFQ